MIVYNKIVRDRIPEIIEKSGKKANCRTVSREDALEGLNTKLTEELQEYLSSKDPEELCDLLEVIHGIAAIRGIEWDDLEKIRLAKREKRGGFEDRVFLVSVEE